MLEYLLNVSGFDGWTDAVFSVFAFTNSHTFWCAPVANKANKRLRGWHSMKAAAGWPAFCHYSSSPFCPSICQIGQIAKLIVLNNIFIFFSHAVAPFLLPFSRSEQCAREGARAILRHSFFPHFTPFCLPEFHGKWMQKCLIDLL